MNNPRKPPPAFPPLPAGAHPTPTRPLKICVASYDFVGPVRNGGVGTAFTSLAEALAAAGHEVTLLYLSGQWCENRTLDHWVRHYRERRIEFVPLPAMVDFPLIASWHQAKSYEAFLWLRDRAFDVVHFSEWRGPGYYSILARRQGLAFPRTALCVHTHGPTFWSRLSNGEYVDQSEDLDLDFLERRSVELADAVISPSQYLLRWMLDQGWKLSPRSFVQPYVRPGFANRRGNPPATTPTRVNELVFFGRLEVRKGLVLFCDALDRLAADPALKDVRLTFLGKLTDVHGVPGRRYLEERARNWPWPWQVFSDKDQAAAMDYLRGPGRLALMPSLADNLPNTVLECLSAGVPFLTSDIGGIPEMVAPADRQRACLPLNTRRFAAGLRRAVTEGITAATPAFDPAENERAWIRWHETEVAALQSADQPAAPADARPLVSVCLSHWNRPGYLRQALASIEAQDYPNIEVVLVDDASTDPEALRYLDELAPRFAARGWPLIRNPEELFVGAARNVAARHARGEYLMFMDDDNCAKPGEIATFVTAARRTGADILTCFLDFFPTPTPPRENETPVHRVLFLGDAAAGGALRNTFGDTNALIRREVFHALGGFHELRGVGHEDWELYADAVLKGYKLAVVPEALVWYRRTEAERSATKTNSLHGGHQRNIRPYLDAVPPALRNLVLFVQGQSLQLEQSGGLTREAAARSQHVIRWRSLFEAGRALARAGHTAQAVHLHLDALKAAEASQHAGAILEALLSVGRELGTLDTGRARRSLELAAQLAQNLRNDLAFKQAQHLLRELESRPAVSREVPAGVVAAGVSPAVEPGVPPGGIGVRVGKTLSRSGGQPGGGTPPSTAGTDACRYGTAPSDQTPPTESLDELLHRSVSLLNSRQDREALALLDRAARRHPQAHRLHYGRALALARLGRRKDARKALRQLSREAQGAGKARLLAAELEAGR